MIRKSFFEQRFGKSFVILDGATGTELVKRGMPAGVCPEKWVTEHPEALIDLQQKYFAAGSDVVLAPSFGANPFKLAVYGLENEVRRINRRVAEISRKAAGNKLVFGDLAPTGKLLAPMGELDFEDAVSACKQQAAALIEGGVDGFTIETMLDLQEARAALIAVRELCDLPVIVTMTFEPGGRTLTGCDAVASLCAIQSLGADAFGCNCSSGPAEMAGLIRAMKPYARIPLVAKPNAGIPHLLDGRTVFDLDAQGFADAAEALADAGAMLLGGCCGTTPEHIQKLTQMLDRKAVIPVSAVPRRVLSSASQICEIAGDAPFVLIGERINPTGKKALQGELREGRFDLVRKFAEDQTKMGADVLDVNFGLAGIDECAMMKQGMLEISAASTLPLCIDSTDVQTVETALRRYPGRALLNSISAEKKRIEKILPVAAKYGAMLILLPLTDDEVPADCAGRKAALERILAEVRKLGYKDADLIVDALVMTISADGNAARSALDFITYVTEELKLPTVGGLSNVSFGMPGREAVNGTFLGMALGRGLCSVIANPSLPGLDMLRKSSDVLWNRRGGMEAFLQAAGGIKASVPGPEKDARSKRQILYDEVLNGHADEAEKVLTAILQETPEEAGKLVGEILIPAINEVGVRFEKKTYFLPQLLASAGAMERAMKHLEGILAKTPGTHAPAHSFVIATVKGDIHDIGKNIVTLLLKNHDFAVYDLGKDVPAQTIVEAVKQYHPVAVGLSALMTTTMPEMKNVIRLLREAGETLPVIVGGAAVDETFARSIGAEYAADAMGTVRLAQKFAGR